MPEWLSAEGVNLPRRLVLLSLVFTKKGLISGDSCQNVAFELVVGRGRL